MEPRHSLLGAESAEAAQALPLWLLSEADYPAWVAGLPVVQRDWLRAHDFRAERGRVLLLPGEAGAPAAAVAGLGVPRGDVAFDPWLAAMLADRLPGRSYVLASSLPGEAATLFALGWLLGQYRFTRYKSANGAVRARLVAPAGANGRYAEAAAEAMAFARDLINTPASDLGPAELADAAFTLGATTGAECRLYAGDELRRDFPLVEAVGRGSPRAPCVVELRYRRPGAPRVALVGKGVCFDSGGLDIKPSSGMLLMKKDMGGAACVLALTQLLRHMDAPVDLRVLVPCVENAVDGHSFRPGDVFRSRKGLTVEIGNTDAEGRLILADALAAASEDSPDLLVDLATLTGAARIALGPELPAVFSGDTGLAAGLASLGRGLADPLWPLPLWDGYDDDLGSRVADVGNVSGSSFAGAITAALFLRRFVSDPERWLHVDLFAWNPRERAGRPQGGEAQVVRALYALIRQRWG